MRCHPDTFPPCPDSIVHRSSFLADPPARSPAVSVHSGHNTPSRQDRAAHSNTRSGGTAGTVLGWSCVPLGLSEGVFDGRIRWPKGHGERVIALCPFLNRVL